MTTNPRGNNDPREVAVSRAGLRRGLCFLAFTPPVLAGALVACFDYSSALRGFFVCLAFASVAVLTRFFAARPRLFVRTFGSRNDVRGVIRFARQPSYAQSMRQMSVLQFVFALWVGATVAVLAWLGLAKW